MTESPKDIVLTFTITRKQQEEADAFIQKRHDEVALKQNRKHPFTGAIGGAVSYEFVSTSIGTIVNVVAWGERHCLTDMWDL